MITAPLPYTISGLSYWFSAKNPSGDNTTPSSGASISTWVNLLQNNLINATNGTPANQPTYVANASNGYPSLAFNGTSQTLGMSNNALLQISSQFFFIATIQLTNLLSATQTIYSKGSLSGSATSVVQISRTAPGMVSFFNGTSWIDSPSNFSKTGSECVVVSINWTGTVYSFLANGTSLGTVSNSTAIPINAENAVIGAQGATSLANKLDGQILDVALYKRQLTAQESLDLYKFFAYRAGLKSL